MLLLFVGWAIGPVAWIIHLSAAYLFAPHACATGNFLPLDLLSAAMLLIAAGGAVLSWRQWKKYGMKLPGSEAGVFPRSRFMSLMGLLVNTLFFVVILAQSIPIVLLRDCT